MSKIIEYKGYKIIETKGFYSCLGLLFKSLYRAKKCIDNTINNINNGLH